VIVRRRLEGDLPHCAQVLDTVHAADAYPSCWPDQPEAWLSPRGCAAGWVAVHPQRPDTILGHVCVVRDVGDTAVTALTGIGRRQLASVSRLFVAPEARGCGLATALLEAVSGWTSARGLRLILDVVEDASSAVALYERLGWRLLDRRLSDWVTPLGNRLPLRLYLAPEPSDPVPTGATAERLRVGDLVAVTGPTRQSDFGHRSEPDGEGK
jgi:GNAT superfamily N-acetyltransferase